MDNTAISIADTLPIERLAPRKRGAHVRLLTADHLDGRTRASKRAKAVARELERAAGPGLTTALRQAIAHAALLRVVAEDLAARRLMGEPIDLNELVKTQSEARRAIRDLKLRPSPPSTVLFSPLLDRARRDAAATPESQSEG
jgi:hypothetical protein